MNRKEIEILFKEIKIGNKSKFEFLELQEIAPVLFLQFWREYSQLMIENRNRKTLSQIIDFFYEK